MGDTRFELLLTSYFTHLPSVFSLLFYCSECKKNKGSILKNSVEYICALQRENQFYSGFHSEANLASTLIGRMVKRIQVGPYDILTQLF